MSQHPTSGLHHLQPVPHKIKIPKRAASYTPATMDNDLRSQLNVQLVAGGHDKKIQEHLLYTLNAHPSNWPTQIQSRALALLRSGEATTFPQLLKQILEEVRKETSLLDTNSKAANGNGSDSSVQVNGGGSSGKKNNSNSNNHNNNGSTSNNNNNNNNNNGSSSGSSSSSSSTSSTSSKDNTTTNNNNNNLPGAGLNPGPGEAGNLHTDERQSLAVPKAVVNDALKVTRDALVSVAEFDPADGGA